MFTFLRFFKIGLYNVCVTSSMFYSEPKVLKTMECSLGGNSGMIKSIVYLERYTGLFELRDDGEEACFTKARYGILYIKLKTYLPSLWGNLNLF